MVTYSDMFTYTLVLCAVATLVASICNKKPKKWEHPKVCVNLQTDVR